MKTRTVLLMGLLSVAAGTLLAETAPVRFAIVSLAHDQARGFIPTTNSRQDVQLVAILEPNSELAAAVRGEIGPTGLSSLEVNLIATGILDAARESARTGKRVELPSVLDGWAK
jgi:hypothetical protein